MSFKSKLTKILIIKKYAKNWLTILWKSLRNESSDVYLKNGVLIKNLIAPSLLMDVLNKGWNIVYHDPKYLILEKNKIKIKCRIKSGFDLGHISEIFSNDTYFIDLKNATVVDIGASNGDSAIYFASIGANNVIALEPAKESYDLGVENIKMNNMEKQIHIINAGLSFKNGRGELKISTLSPNANSLNPTEAIIKMGNKFDSISVVDMITLGNIVKEYNIDKIDLLKMDCEGCEYDSLKNLNGDIFNIINTIIMEFHNGPGFIPDLLKSYGYNVEYEKDQNLGILRATKNEISN